MSGLRRQLVVVAGLLISGVALWLVLQTIDVGEAVAVIGRANPAFLLAIIGVVAVQATLRAWRWSILIPVRDGGPRPATLRLLPPMLVGYLGNTVLPARLGEPMRAVIAARRERIGMTEALGSVLVERLVDIAMLAVVGFTAALIVAGPAWTIQLLGAAAAVGVAGMLVLLTVGLEPLLRLADRVGLGNRPVVRDLAARFVATLGGRSRRGALLAAAGISVAAWILDAGSFWLAAHAVGVDLPYLAAAVVDGVSVMGTALPSAPGFVGTFDLAASGTAGALGVPGAQALAMAVVVHVMTLVPLALGGAVSLAAMGASLGEVAHAAEASGHD
jgi:glycosyltransferase 2 family protein